MSTENERLKELQILLGFKTQQLFAEALGIKQGSLSDIYRAKDGMGVSDSIKLTLNKEYSINIGWLETGKGDYLEPRNAAQGSEPEVSGMSTGKIIPFFDVEAAAGAEYSVSVEPATRPAGQIEIGGLLRDSESALRVYGNSMTPNYPAGCVVGLRRHYDSFIEPGYVYVIETADNRYLKRLYYNQDRSAFRCISDNHMVHDTGPLSGEFYYPVFEIPFTDVKKLFRVVGVIKRNIL